MAQTQSEQTAPSTGAADIVAQVDTGARRPTGAVAKVLMWTAFAWSVFQLWIASPLPFIFRFGVLNNTESRAIHLAFAIFLAYLAYPALKRSPRDRIPLQDWVFAILGAFAAAYIFLFYDQLASRPGAPTGYDLVIAIVGMVILLEATRRALGPPLMIVAGVFLLYTFAGPWMPDVIAHKGQSLSKVMSHQWLTTEGVFGVALGVSTDFVFLFVLFGAMLEQAGAGNFFIKLAFSLLGHMRGGPAKAAVVASGATGLISGSSIANVATTGTFTIPLMKRVGFPAYKAGAVEVAASTNGQLTPPVMGAAAFLMVEYVGISYIEVIKHAILPALISYVALFYIVHLEAVKADMYGLTRRHQSTLAQKLMTFAGIVLGLCAIGLGVYYGVGWVKTVAGDAAFPIIVVAVLAVYLGLLGYSTRFPELTVDDPQAELLELPEPGPTVKSGMFFFLPIIILMWCLVVERFSPATAAFWATLFMVFIVLTQRPLLAVMRSRSGIAAAAREGLSDFVNGMIAGARNMIGIGVATAAAGIVVGTITLTGIGQVMVGFVEFISGGNLLLALLFTAAICIVLGMGLPTTANYIVVSSLMAPVVVAIGEANGLLVPLIAVHMFVFYFGILADDTPPVGLAAFAASAIARSDPIRTGIQGFTYDIRTAILPFMFIFNTQLLLIGLTGITDLVITVVTALIAMLVFAAATQGYWMVRNRWWETAGLLLVAFTLFRPGFWWDMVQPPFDHHAPVEIERLAAAVPADGSLRMVVQGETLDGDFRRFTARLPMGAEGPGADRLQNAGLVTRVEDDGKVYADDVMFGSPAQNAGLDFDWEIVQVETPADRWPKEVMFIPALLLLALLWKVQMARWRGAPETRSAQSAA